MTNYFNNVMVEGFELLAADNVDWPYELTQCQQVELLTQAMMYFEEQEEYEKCSILQQKIELVNNPPKRKRGRPRKVKINLEKKEVN
jgi:hypothetical protein